MIDGLFLAVGVPAVLIAGISKGGFGSGAAFAGAVLLALVVEPGAALAVMLPLLMLMDVTALRFYWRQWDPAATRLMVLGGVPGVAAGAALWSVLSADAVRLIIGVIAVGFVAFQIARDRGWLTMTGLPAGRGAGLAWGAVAGFTSFISHAGGPAAAIFLLSRGLDKRRFQATTVAVFWLLNVAKFVPYAALGIFSRDTLLAGLILSPLAVLGIWAGVRLHRAIPQGAFFVIMYGLLTVTGLRLIWVGLA